MMTSYVPGIFHFHAWDITREVDMAMPVVNDYAQACPSLRVGAYPKLTKQQKPQSKYERIY